MQFKVISCSTLTSTIFSVSSIQLVDIKDKKDLRCLQNLGNKVMELCIMSDKT